MGPSPLVFYGLFGLLIAFFGVATWATFDPSLQPAAASVQGAAETATPMAAASRTTTVTSTATPATSPTAAVVVVERRPPTQTPRPSPSATPGSPTPAPSATPAPPSPSATATATVTATATMTPTASATATETVTASPTAPAFVHVVKPGDTLMGLGQRYGVPWQAIAAANGLPEDTVLRLDQQLVIPQAS